MRSSTKDRIEGKFDEVKGMRTVWRGAPRLRQRGKVEEKAGQVIDNPDLESEGKSENLGCKVRKIIAPIGEVFDSELHSHLAKGAHRQVPKDTAGPTPPEESRTASTAKRTAALSSPGSEYWLP